MGEILGSIAEDGHFKLWEEDILETPHSTRRFKSIFNTRSETKVPFCSLDFKNLHTETYAALITRDGYLSIYEPVDHDNLAGEWSAMAQKYVCPTPSRQDETGFKVAWHKEKVPCWTAVEAGLDRRALSLAVAAMNVVKIYRTDKDRKWYLATELTGARSIIRDVAWANGSMRGFDVIATASKDGALRVYEVSTVQRQASTAVVEPPSITETPASPLAKAQKPSGIGAGLASPQTRGVIDSDRGDGEQQSTAPGRIRHIVKNVAELNSHGGAVWRVAFSQLGDLLVSTGDDGSVRTWKKALDGLWTEYAHIDLAAGDP
jgi:nucleoporin SEH1